MRLVQYFGFAPLPVTFVVCITYLAIFAATIAIHEYGWDSPPEGSKERLGFDLEGAMSDLRVIARQAHPFNSKRNDVVHDYLVSRVQSISSGHAYVEIVDDVVSNVTFINGGVLGDQALAGNAMYYEGNNVLVKIEGERPELPAVLLSAHYDSVSTAPGATDDGVAVCTLLQLITHYTASRPPRTLIFNINNAEEDGLFGARVFLSHPWSKLPKTFLNLEGAGQAGRALLFRTSSPHVTRAYNRVPHPHGNAITADAFKRKVVRSNTDYVVYEEAGMEGLDVAFYRGRSRYHTAADDVPGLRGDKALWSMLESGYYATEGLMRDEQANVGGEVVFFDVLGSAIAVFTLQTVFIINIVLLILGPLAVGALLWYTHIKRRVAFSLQGWARFPVAFLLSFAGTIALAILYARINPFIVHSASYVVLLSLFSLAFVLLALTLRLFASFRPVHQQKLIVLLELYIFWWFLLAISTGFEGAPARLVAPYFVTLFHTGTLFGLLLGLLETALLEWRGSKEKERIVRLPENGDDLDADVEHAGVEAEEVPTEQTPLVPRVQPVDAVHKGEEQISGLWLFQFWLAVVFPAIWAMQTVLLLMTSLGQGLTDGSAPLTVYLGTAVFAFLIVLQLAPFLHAMHFSVTITLLLTLAGSTLWCLFAPPFTPSYPFKAFYRQTVSLDTTPVRNEVMLGGISEWVEETVLSGWKTESEVTCGQSMDVMFRPGLKACVWEGTSAAEGMGVDFVFTLTGRSTARLRITGANTRSCGVRFDKPVKDIWIRDAAPATSALPGISNLALMSRTWNRTFELEFSFPGDMEGGSVYCEYADARPGQIPELDEVLESIPVWATVTKGGSGLVIASKSWKLPGLEELN